VGSDAELAFRAFSGLNFHWKIWGYLKEVSGVGDPYARLAYKSLRLAVTICAAN